MSATDSAEIRRFFSIIHPHGQVFEVRIPKAVGVTVNGHPERGGPKTISGFYDNVSKAAADVAKAMSTGHAPGVYGTLNAPNPALLARAANRLKVAEATTSDADVPDRSTILIDGDPVRPAGISATDAEKELARIRIEAVRDFLTSCGLPPPLFVDSGNGFHLLYRVDLPGDDGGLVERFLKALAERFSDSDVKIDTTVANAARISKIPGTLAAKGDSTAERPHRMARIIEVPEPFQPVPRELLEKIALPAKTETPRPAAQHGTFDIDEWISRHLPEAKPPVPYNSGRKWVLDPCPFNPDHTRTSSALFQLSGGGVSFKCQHNGCSGRGWNDLREMREGPRKQRTNWPREQESAAEPAAEPEPWPEPVPFTSPMDLPEFPLEALPPELADFVSEASASIQIAPEAPASIALACVSAAAARNFVVAVGETHEEPVNIMVDLVMGPGDRKSQTHRCFTAPLEDLQKELSESMAPEIAKKQAKRAIQDQRLAELTKRAAKEDDASERARLEEEAGELAAELEEVPAAPRLIVGDITPEKGVTMLAQQAGRLAMFDADSGFFELAAGRYSGAPNFEWVLKAHAGDTIRVDRHTRQDTVERPALTMCICTQPSVVEGTGQLPAFKQRGLLARFMWVIPDSRVGTRIYANRHMNPTAAAAYSSAIKAVFRLPKAPGDQPHRLVLAGDALEEWATFANRIEREQVDGARLCGMRDWASKAAGLAARIAGLFHVLRYRNSHPAGFEIGLEDVVSAVAIADWATDHALCAYGLMEADETIGLAKRLLKWIERTRDNPKFFKPSGETVAFSRSDCHRHHQSFGKPEDLNPALEILEARGFIRRLPDPPKVGKGRPPSPRFEISPLYDANERNDENRSTPAPGPNSLTSLISLTKERVS